MIPYVLILFAAFFICTSIAIVKLQVHVRDLQRDLKINEDKTKIAQNDVFSSEKRMFDLIELYNRTAYEHTLKIHARINECVTLQGNGVLDPCETKDEYAFRLAMKQFQEHWATWMDVCYVNVDWKNDPAELNRRFLEEALEVVQACGFSKEETLHMVDYVYSRPAGHPPQEVAGAFSTLAVLCVGNGIELGGVSNEELAMCWSRINQIREKQKTKPKYEQPAGA